MTSNPFIIQNSRSPTYNDEKILGKSPSLSSSPIYSNGIDMSPKFDRMNYSPKHTRNTSSISSRNINHKNLSLNLSDPVNDMSSKPLVGGEKLKNSKNLTLSIPSRSKSQSMGSIESVESLPTPKKSKELDSYKFPHPPKTAVMGGDSSISSSPLKGQSSVSQSISTNKLESNIESPFIDSFQKVNLNLPVELQELSQIDAYPNGPKHVLNDFIYLYSQPTVAEINNFDLVINVAKECPDLSQDLRNPNGDKKYVFIPWNHNSSILEQLPYLTDLIKSFDPETKPENAGKKVLVHCNCGVSRSVCVIIAYFMQKYKLSVIDAYELLKSGRPPPIKLDCSLTICGKICPNMNLIFELMDFNNSLTES